MLRQQKMQQQTGVRLMETIKCLDHGSVTLIDSMGNDASIVQAARVSYEAGNSTVRTDDELINYLWRNGHTSPFEMVELKFIVQCPLFVMRQWIRHRTANVNEISARYSVLPDLFYVPDADILKSQGKTNKQGSEGALPDNIKELFRINTINHAKKSYELYLRSLENGISREEARMNLPVNIYTKFVWKNDLHNTLKFLSLRLDSHAQYEIRVFAQAIYDSIKKIVPVTCKAFEDYTLNSIKFNAKEQECLKKYLQDSESRVIFQNIITDGFGFSNGEIKEFINKLDKLRG